MNSLRQAGTEVVAGTTFVHCIWGYNVYKTRAGGSSHRDKLVLRL
jgi:hypothetical protein|eukprot:COSAG02_NODE_4037_length_5876_cov_16.519474_5_plen_45_part_00